MKDHLDNNIPLLHNFCQSLTEVLFFFFYRKGVLPSRIPQMLLIGKRLIAWVFPFSLLLKTEHFKKPQLLSKVFVVYEWTIIINNYILLLRNFFLIFLFCFFKFFE